MMHKFATRFTPLFLFIFGTLAMSYDLTVPSFWQDEAATLAGANRPIPVLLEMAKKIDVVHSFYYGFMHFWSSTFGFSVLWMRMPSILAVGLTCAFIYLLVRKLNGTYSMAVWASLLYLAIPRTHFASGESRSNALTATLAVGLTLALVTAVQGKSRPILKWLGYAAIAALSTYDFMFSFLIVVPHAVYILTRHRKEIWRFVGAWVLALAASMPLFYWGYKEKNQVSWIKIKPLSDYLKRAIIDVNFLSRTWIAVVFIALGVLAVGIYLWNRRRKTGTEMNELTEVAFMWTVLPPAALITASFALHPYFVEHYLTFTTPGAAIMASIGLSRLRYKWVVAGVGITALVMGFFSLQDARNPRAHGPIWMPVIQDVAKNTAPGDGILLPDWRTRNSAEVQLMLGAYRIGYLPGRVDLTLIDPPTQSNTLFGIHAKEKDAPQPAKLMNKIALVADLIDPLSPTEQAPDWVTKNYTITGSKTFDDAVVTYFKKKSY
jgi:mannosyltransferase